MTSVQGRDDKAKVDADADTGVGRRGVVVGVLLAAGAGRRLGLGTPKALVADEHGRTWLDRSVGVLREGGADQIYVVVGSDAPAVEAAMPAGALTIHAPDWEEGMGASLRAGLVAVQLYSPGADAVLVMLVDTPGVGSEVVRRLREHAAPGRLARAAYGGTPGHPVLIGSEHLLGVLDMAAGDSGARDYLKSTDVALVECGDIGSGEDVDDPAALGAWLTSQRQL